MPEKETCTNCGREIKVTIYKGTGHCSEGCNKTLKGDTGRPQAQTDAGITNILAQPTGEVNLNGIR
jgi:ribosomal protein L37AE/L43A